MTASPPPATILVVTAEASEAERIGGLLREGGLAARTLALGQLDKLKDVLARQRADLIVCCAYESHLDLDAMLAAHRQQAAALPLILIIDQETKGSDLVRARRAGMRDSALRGDPDHLVAILRRELADLQSRRDNQRLSDALAQCGQRSRELIEVSRDAIAFVQEGLHVAANPAYLRLFGYDDVLDLQATPYLDLIASEQRKAVREFLRTVEFSQQTEMAALGVTCLRKDGSTLPAQLMAAQSAFEGDACLRLILQTEAGVAARASLPAESSPIASLLAQIEARISPDRSVERPFVVFYVRVTEFAERVRNLGLTRSLAMIDDVAKGFGAQFVEAAFVGRVNDDGIAVIVEDIDASVAEALTARLGALGQPSDGQGTAGAIRFNCEVGFSLVQGRAPAAEDILNTAQRSCVERNVVPIVPHSGGPGKTSLATRQKQSPGSVQTDDAELVRKIRQALDEDRFKLVYQPIISLMGDHQENYSVLVRFIDAQDRLYEAKDFIGPAIHNGLIEEIDRWAIRAAIQVLGEQRKSGHNLGFFVNLAEDSFRNPNIVIWICDCLREFDVRGSWLTFLFQEELVAANLASLGKLVEALKKIRCRVAINYFGAADHPEILLQGLPSDFVLFMPEFAAGLAEDPKKQQQVSALANLAREFNVKSIVTGVEDARTLTVLWTAGIDYVQGNFLQRPSPTLEIQVSAGES